MASQRERELQAEVKRLKERLQQNDSLIQKTAMKMVRLEAAHQSLYENLAERQAPSPRRKKR
jgi:hypothetical protein